MKVAHPQRLFVFSIIVLFLLVILVPLLLIHQYKTVSENTKDDSNEESNRKSSQSYDEQRKILKVAEVISPEGSSVNAIPIFGNELIYKLSIDGRIELPSVDSYVRAVLVDKDNNEYLIYEAYPLLASTQNYQITQACEETCFLDGVEVQEVIVKTEKGGVLDIEKIDKDTTPVPLLSQEEKDIKREEILAEKVEIINEEIERNNMEWKAGITPFSMLSYAEKKNMFQGDMPNLQGLEFYIGGVFEAFGEANADIPPAFLASNSSRKLHFFTPYFSKSKINFLITDVRNRISDLGKNTEVKSSGSFMASTYVDSWDWRKAHDADNPSTFYFDGNHDANETGNGWITAVKNQASCGSCWAFAATGATEALVNLYYNQHLDLNLAEQDALSCSGAGSCNGGWPGVTLDYYTTTGVVNEACFPYTATDQSCLNKCSNPTERIRIGGKVGFGQGAYSPVSEDNLKKMILELGPISGGIYSMSHAMTLIGWYTDGTGSTVWIFKNSWGNTWGDHGYMYVKTAITNIGWTFGLLLPVSDLNTRQIRCVDADGDGYYNWGLSASKPASCPQGISDQKDCDDSNSSLNTFTERYECIDASLDTYISTASNSFEPVPVGQMSSSKIISIKNIRDYEVTLSDISLSNETDFILDQSPEGQDLPCNSYFALSSQGECTIAIVARPMSEGIVTTNLIVNSNTVSQISFSVSGTYEPEVVCSYFKGDWFNERCFGLTTSQCTDYRGTVNNCDTTCPSGMGCLQQCNISCVY